MIFDIAMLGKMLALDEGKRALPYEDDVGKITIGIGRNLTDNGLSEAEIYLLLTNDIQDVEDDVSSLDWFTPLDPVRRLVIADMCFNLGLKRLLGFKNMIVAIKVKDYEIAALEMIDSKWARQVGKRAYRLAHMMRTGKIHHAYLSES